MKLLRWTLAGASFYVIYKYAIGKKAKGEDVFVSPDVDGGEASAAAVPRARKPRKPKSPSGK